MSEIIYQHDYYTKIIPFTKEGELVDVQNPTPSDGDSVYVKDIDLEHSDNGNFTADPTTGATGSVSDYFNSLKTVNEDTTANNPKTIKLWFNRTIYSHAIGFGCDDTSGGGFGTDITIKLLGSGEIVRATYNYTGIDPNSFLAEFNPAAFNGVTIEFNTASTVCLSNITIRKSIDSTTTIQGQDPNGNIQNVNVTSDGDLSISDNSNGLAIAEGNVTGKTFVHKFGNAPDFDSGDGEVYVWDGANDAVFGGSPPMTYTFSSTADIGTISSDSAGDTQNIEIQGLDTNYDLVDQTITLNGQTDVSLSTNLIRVFRMINRGSTDIAGVVYLRTNGSGQTLGVPDTANTVRAIINNGNNQTEMAIYTVPNGKTGYVRSFYASSGGANKTSNYIMRLKERPDGEVFQLKHRVAIGDTSPYQHKYIEPEKFDAKTDIIMTSEIAAGGISGASVSAGYDIVIVDN